MPGYATHLLTARLGGRDYRVRALAGQGYAVSERRSRFNATDMTPFRGRLPGCRR